MNKLKNWALATIVAVPLTFAVCGIHYYVTHEDSATQESTYEETVEEEPEIIDLTDIFESILSDSLNYDTRYYNYIEEYKTVAHLAKYMAEEQNDSNINLEVYNHFFIAYGEELDTIKVRDLILYRCFLEAKYGE